MIVDDSIPDSASSDAQPSETNAARHLTVITPPTNEVIDLRSSEAGVSSLSDLHAELTSLRERVMALEGERLQRSDMGQQPAPRPSSVSSPATAPKPAPAKLAPGTVVPAPASPAWRTKSSRVSGWQPARR